MAVARTLLCIAWAVMRYDGDYIDAGTDWRFHRGIRGSAKRARLLAAICG